MRCLLLNSHKTQGEGKEKKKRKIEKKKIQKGKRRGHNETVKPFAAPVIAAAVNALMSCSRAHILDYPINRR